MTTNSKLSEYEFDSIMLNIALNDFIEIEKNRKNEVERRLVFYKDEESTVHFDDYDTNHTGRDNYIFTIIRAIICERINHFKSTSHDYYDSQHAERYFNNDLPFSFNLICPSYYGEEFKYDKKTGIANMDIRFDVGEEPETNIVLANEITLQF